MTVEATRTKAPTRLTARPRLEGGAIELRWTNPPAAAFESGFLRGVQVVRRERSHPQDPTDGHVVHAATDPIVDHLLDTGLRPVTRYYYTVFAHDGATHHADTGSRADALATGYYDVADRLYRMLPAAHQRDDRGLLPDEWRALSPEVQERLRALPSTLQGAGQLRRFLAAAAAPLGLSRSTAEALRQIHDVDQVPPAYLPLMAAFLDWRTDLTLPVHSQRNEVRAAPSLYRTVGSVPNLRSIVTRYTGWQTRVAEYAQHITRSHQVAQGNVFALRETSTGWTAATDAAEVLGFGPGNTGAGTSEVTGTTTEPFALRPGMGITLHTEATGAVTGRFHRTDAASLSAATAAEVAAALTPSFEDVTVTARPDGRLRLVAHHGTVRVEQDEAGLVTLDGAPRGRLAVLSTGPVSLRLFHAVADPLSPVEQRAARRAVSGRGFPSARIGPESTPTGAVGRLDPSPWLPSAPVAQIHHKPFRGGEWGDSTALFDGAEPAAASLPPVESGALPRVLLAWVRSPDTPRARIHFAIGTVRAARPAVLVGDNGSPFAIRHGSFLVLRSRSGGTRAVQFARSQFTDPDRPTVGDVVAVLNARLGGFAVASAAPGGAVRLHSPLVGGDARLEVDLSLSDAAASLGFHSHNAGATGAWDDEIDWQPQQEVPGLAPGRAADLCAVADGSEVLLAYSRHDGRRWQARLVRYDGTTWTSDQALSTGVQHAREVTLARDDDGRAWAVWSEKDASSGRWSLRQRSRPTTGLWTAEGAVVTGAAPPGVGDREPSVRTRTGQPPRVFFRSDRAGGSDLWSVVVGSTPSPVMVGAPADGWPAPVSVGGTQWLLYRSDRSVGHASVGGGRYADTGTLHRYAGTTSVVMADIDRLRRLRDWDDLLSYTPHRPDGGASSTPLRDDEIYTRGTVGLYLTHTASGLLDDSMAERLRAVLTRFVPVNVRVVVRLAPAADIETVYSPAEDLHETYLDRHPDIDHVGAATDRTAVRLPGWATLTSAELGEPPPADPDAGGVAADPSDPSTLRWRSAHPPHE
jgi:phage tail-like protein